MAVNTFPAVASPVKSVQRGSAGGAGTVTITSVNIAKSMVNIFGTTSTGTVSASFNMSMNAGNTTAYGVNSYNPNNFGDTRIVESGATQWAHAQNSAGSNLGGFGTFNTWRNTSVAVNSGTASVGAGSTNLVAAVVQGYLSDSTSLVVSGACRYEVVEFN